MSYRKTYRITLFLILAGYIWIYFNYTNRLADKGQFTVCLFKNITGIPCPSCGITRSIISLMHLDLNNAFHWNPLGFLALVAMIVFPVWIMTDMFFRKNSLFAAYKRMERFFQQRWVAISSAFIILLIWLNNINNKL